MAVEASIQVVVVIVEAFNPVVASIQVVVIEEAFSLEVASIPVAVIGVAFNPVVASSPVEVVQDEEVSIQAVAKIAKAVLDRREAEEMDLRPVQQVPLVLAQMAIEMVVMTVESQVELDGEVRVMIPQGVER